MLEVAGVHIEFVPGSTYNEKEAPEDLCPKCEGRGQWSPRAGVLNICPICQGRGRVKRESTKEEGRAAAVKQFQTAAQKSTLPAINQLIDQVLALVIQYRAVGGTLVESGLANKLREAADFMEDL